MGQGSELKHRTIRRLDHQFIRWLHLNHTETRQFNCFSTGWTDAWIGVLSGSSDGLIQITQYRPECEAFSTGWSDGASVYSVGAMSVFLGSTAILDAISDRMIRRFAEGDHRFIRRYYFFRKPFLTASLPCQAYKYDPLPLLSWLCHSEDPLQPRREGECVLAIWDSLPLDWGPSFLVSKSFKVHTWLSWVLKSVKWRCAGLLLLEFDGS
jgi:hypothetical protein